MSDHPRPRTAEELMALPIGGGFGMIERVIDGKLVRMATTMEQSVAIYHGPDDIISCSDETGAWMLGRYADGRWFRKRM